MEIKVRYNGDLERIERIPVGDWIDLRAEHDEFIRLYEFKMISLGVSMQLPDGYEAHVLPRSSTFRRYGIIMVNGMGIIDNSYCGDNDIWQFPAFCIEPRQCLFGQAGTCIEKNERIAQFRIVKKQPEDIVFTEVDHLLNPNRGGFGSTGVI